MDRDQNSETAVDQLKDPADPRLGMDLSLYVEAELERQKLRDQVDDLEKEIEQLKSYLAAQAVKKDAESQVYGDL